MLSKERKGKLEANIWKFYLVRISSALLFAIPIFVLYLQENGMSLTQIMILNAVYTTFIMLSVVPSGVIADYLGRKRVLFIESILYASGWGIYAYASTFWGFFLGEVVMAISAGMWMSCSGAFMYDTLRELNREGEYQKIWGNVTGLNSMSMAFASIIGGLLAAVSLRFNMWVSTAAMATSIIFTLMLTETKDYKHGDTKYFSHLKNAFLFASKHPRVRLFIIYSAITAAIYFTLIMFYQPYLKLLGIPVVWFGAIYFIMFIISALGSKYAHKIEGLLGEKKTLTMILVIFICAIIGICFRIPAVGVIFPIMIGFCYGLFDPVITDYINKNTDSHHRATVMSLQIFSVEILSTAVAPLFGYLADSINLEAAYAAGGLILLVNLFILVAVFRTVEKKTLKED